MTWATFYLICFAFGFTLSALSLLSGLGRLHLPAKLHLHFGLHSGLHGGVAQGGIAQGGTHAGLCTHAHVASAAPGTHAIAHQNLAGRSAGASPINFFTLMAFLTWFGGTGYLLTQYSSMWFALGLLIATMSGMGGAAVIFLFLTKVVLAHETNLEPEEMIGVLGRLSVGIRPGGTGEMVYAQGGTRHTCGARAEDGTAVSKGTEVVVTGYEKGIAYVRRWEDLAHE